MAKIMKVMEPALYDQLMRLAAEQAETKLQDISDEKKNNKKSDFIKVTAPRNFNEEIKNIVNRLCKYQRFKARKILEILVQSNQFSWDEESFEFTYNEKKSSESNLIDLISFVTATPSSKRKKPADLDLFLMIVKKLNVPLYYLISKSSKKGVSNLNNISFADKKCKEPHLKWININENQKSSESIFGKKRTKKKNSTLSRSLPK
jgi:hypothetical protein